MDTAQPATENAKTTRQTIYLKDYTPPAFWVDTVDLGICIFADETLVTSTLKMRKNTAADFSDSDITGDDIVLFGRALELLEISLNGEMLTDADYTLDNEKLTLKNAPDEATIITKVRIHPETNTTLEGLYLAGKYEGAEQQDVTGMFVTQCEPEGFRKITFYPDRPDVMAVFTTRLEAPKNLPTLLANGNLVEKGDLDGKGNEDRHFAIWHDPTKKPSYLFACVGADLALLKDSYTTSEGRDVALEIYAEKCDIDKCHVAMQALKDSMRWDEDHYGRAYDLDNYMIVATGMFNMGAMENKGLNIFNTACVLSSPEATTDARNLSVKAIIAHEYFHNWTGNRITCRDWFQLCLKEGFTVFRDQSFSESVQSPAVQRIDDVSMLKARQFPEDAGPLAHPPRPDHFVEINNFYTATVYEKGAEVARMIAGYLGKKAFRRGTDSYFARFDGMAVTVEDMLDAFSDNGSNEAQAVDVRPFLDWYAQAGTPEVTVKSAWDATTKSYTLTMRQSVREVKGHPVPKPLPIPVDVALFDDNGKLLTEQTLMLDEPTQTFALKNIQSENAPKVSLLRNFSAPVKLHYGYTDSDLAFLITHEPQGYNRWQAAQTLLERYFEAAFSGQEKEAAASADVFVGAMRKTLPTLSKTDPLLATRLLDIPSENQLASSINENYDPQAIFAIRDGLKTKIATELNDGNFWQKAYHLYPITDYADNSEAMGRRAWRNAALMCAFKAGSFPVLSLQKGEDVSVAGDANLLAEATDWAIYQYDHASCMTERLVALQALAWNQEKLANPQVAQDKLDEFYNRFEQDELVIDMWFGVQAANPAANVTKIAELLDHPRFDYGVPNRIRSVASHLANAPTKVWTDEGVDFFVALTGVLDEKNPILASRILQSLSRWYTLTPDMKNMAQGKLDALAQAAKSPSVVESLGSMLKGG